MQLVNKTSKNIQLRLCKDLRKQVLQGHPWVFNGSLSDLPSAPAGSPATLVDKKGDFLAYGYYNPKSILSFRVCSLEKKQKANSFWADKNLLKAVLFRKQLNFTNTNCYRLINGEGDQLPGLICDLYNDTAVIQLDGDSAIGFWQKEALAQWIKEKLSLKCVVYKPRGDLKLPAEVLLGKLNTDALLAVENGAQFYIDAINGQKTGFFLDQRENRNFIRKISNNLSVLNLFAYTGGFSVYAGLGGAKEVTSVDISGPACEYAQKNWELNKLDPLAHTSVKKNVFDFIEHASENKKKWDLVIVDPPSFANNKTDIDKAINTYENIFSKSVSLVAPGGLLALSSCSSLISPDKFLQLNSSAFSKARKRAYLKKATGQPADHPFPLACTSLQYLKFNLYHID